MTERASRWLVVLTVAAGVGLFTASTGHAQDEEASADRRQSHGNEFNAWNEFDARVLRGFRIAPVPLNLRRLNPVLVGLGSYIVNGQGGCNDCHTAPLYAEGGDPFKGEPEQINAAGYLAGGTPFGPVITSRNLTPRPNGRPANLTYEQFVEAMRKGTDFKNRHPEMPLLQVMPWPVYGKMRTLDLRAIYEYLKAIPSLPTPATPGAPEP